MRQNNNGETRVGVHVDEGNKGGGNRKHHTELASDVVAGQVQYPQIAKSAQFRGDIFCIGEQSGHVELRNCC